MSLPSVRSIEVTTDRVWITLSNATTVPVTVDEANRLATDPQAAARFLATWASPKGYLK
jgi:hypothetical protein